MSNPNELYFFLLLHLALKYGNSFPFKTRQYHKVWLIRSVCYCWLFPCYTPLTGIMLPFDLSKDGKNKRCRNSPWCWTISSRTVALRPQQPKICTNRVRQCYICYRNITWTTRAGIDFNSCSIQMWILANAEFLHFVFTGELTLLKVYLKATCHLQVILSHYWDLFPPNYKTVPCAPAV